MRRVIGRRITEVDVGYVESEIARAGRVVADLGTGVGPRTAARVSGRGPLARRR